MSTVRLDVMSTREDRDISEPVSVAALPAKAMQPDALALQLCELLQDAANEAGRNITGACVALDAGAEVARLPVKCRPAAEVLDALKAGTSDEMDGSTRSDRAQDQRHREAMVRLQIMREAENRAAYDSIVSHLMAHNERLMERLAQTEEREDQQRALVRAIEDEVARQAAEAAESGGDDQATAMALQVIGPAVMRLLSGTGRVKQQQSAAPSDGLPATDDE